MADFEKALAFTLKWEGGFVNHPNDPGGATNKGITQNVYNAYRDERGLPKRTVKQITDLEVKDIYRSKYWRLIRGDELPHKVSIALFDFAVNSGPTRAKKKLQEILGLETDGAFGPITMKTIGQAPDSELADELVDERERFVRGLAQSRPKLAVFLKGWLNRINDLRKFLDTV